MNRIYEIKLCDSLKVNKVKHFIDAHWKNKHVLATSQELLDFQHYEKDSHKYNFIIAINNLSGEIDGLMGFIPTFHYDKDLESEKDYWGAIWKVREDIKNEEIKTLGLFLFDKFSEITSFNTYGAIGINSQVKKMYKLLGYRTGTLNQYYLLNEAIRDFRIAKIGQYRVEDVPLKNPDFHLENIDNFNAIKPVTCSYNPKKTVAYFKNRYLNHPIYNYSFFGIYQGGDLRTVLALRVIKIDQAKIIRVVDLLGDYGSLPNLYGEIQSLLSKEGAEYIDCLNYGIPEQVFLNAGFKKLELEDKNIIPNYFEPFEKRNIFIEFAYKSSKPYMIFKGDSDQDRPNII